MGGLSNRAALGRFAGALALFLGACACGPHVPAAAVRHGSGGTGGADRERRQAQPQRRWESQPRLTGGEILTILDLHNQERSAVGVGTLAWSDDLAEHAQAWAARLAERGGVLEHRPTSGTWRRCYGENLYRRTVGWASPADAVLAWADEKADYRGGPVTRRTRPLTGHYTQIVWRETSSVGCGQAVCGDDLIVVCNYDPPGNVVGQKPY